MNLSNLSRILEAREERVRDQQELLKNGGVLVSFSLNIPGPVKQAVLYRYVFETGLERLKKELEKELKREPEELKTGCSAAGFYAYLLLRPKQDETEESLALKVKEITVGLEEEEKPGRLYDMDVLRLQEGEPAKISRKQLGKPERECLVCNAPAFVCVRALRHPAAEVLMKAVDRILSSGEIQRKICPLEALEPAVLEALRALLYEVVITPKPGLVDTENSGAHRDMNITTFFDSALTLVPYLQDCLKAGRGHAGKKPEELLPLLRAHGLEAEKRMYEATGGVNTHKGAVFTFGVLLGAVGLLESCNDTADRLSESCRDTADRGPGLCSTDSRESVSAEQILLTAGRICAGMENGNPYFRREVLEGYPSVRFALRYLDLLNRPVTVISGVETLLCLMSRTEDSNVIRRNGPEAAERMRKRAEELLHAYRQGDAADPQREKEFLQAVSVFDQDLIRENSSPGGAADLLAVTCFLRLLQRSAVAQKV